MRTDVKKKSAILEVEGKAEAILKLQDATARGLKFLKEVI